MDLHKEKSGTFLPLTCKSQKVKMAVSIIGIVATPPLVRLYSWGLFAVNLAIYERKVFMATKQLQSKAQKLLLEYRPTKWRRLVLEAVPGTGHNALQACIEQIHLTKELVDVLRSDKLLGEKLYWIIYASYMTDREPGDVEEILSDIAKRHERIPRRTYFRLRERALKMLDNHLEEMSKERVSVC